MPAISLEELNRQIAQRERELETLRQELESRRSQFTTLTRRKEELLGQLRQVESEIAALSAAQSAQPKQAKATSPKTAPMGKPTKGRPRMGEMIVATLRATGKAMTARQLSEELNRRGFPLSTHNPVKSVESRLQDMKKQRLVQRAAGRPGYVLGAASRGAKAERSGTTSPTTTQERKAAATLNQPAPSAKTVPPGQPNKQPSLREALTTVLKNNARKFLSGSELAELTRASGYKTKSKKFIDAVWSMLGKMKNVEHVKGKGYRLKKS